MMMQIERVWAMPNKETFTIKPIRELIQEEYNPTEIWFDAFAGDNSPADYTNDLNPNSKAYNHKDALDYLKDLYEFALRFGYFAGGFFDPPYSLTQAKQCYESYGAEHLKNPTGNMAYWAEVKDYYAKLIKPGGKVICCDWSCMGLGKNRGFEMTRVLIVPHGGSKNATIVTVEKRRDDVD